MRTPRSILLIVLALLCAAPAQAAVSGPASSTDPARLGALEQSKAEAATLLEKGEAAKAYALYMRLLRTAPDDDAVNLGLARAAAKAKRWNQAVLAYETLLEKHPGEAALYGELAHVYMLLGDREAAERSLAMMRALDGSGTKAETDKALDALESRYSDFQIHGKVRLGLQYDSNATLGPDSNEVQLGRWPVTLRNAKGKDSFGAYLGADLDLGKRFYRDSSWWMVGDVQAFWRGHGNHTLHKRRSQEAQWGRAAAGLRHLTSSTLSELRLKVEVFDYEFYQAVTAYGPEGTFLWAATPSLHFIFKGGIEKREYSLDYLRDGAFGTAGAYGRVFFGADNHEFLIGGRYMGANADKRDYGHNGREGAARFLFKLPRGFELSPFVSYSPEFYVGPATALEADPRTDTRFRAGIGLTYRINESWAVELGYQYTYNSSNSELYTYTQHYVNTGVVWSF
jgi:opacity protein-like surface antigen